MIINNTGEYLTDLNIDFDDQLRFFLQYRCANKRGRKANQQLLYMIRNEIFHILMGLPVTRLPQSERLRRDAGSAR